MSIPDALTGVAHYLIFAHLGVAPPGISRHALIGVYPSYAICMHRAEATYKVMQSLRREVVFMCLSWQDMAQRCPELLPTVELDGSSENQENRPRPGTYRHSSCLSTGYDPGYCASRPGFLFWGP